jgi:thiol:disulfide interchange protein DsbC
MKSNAVKFILGCFIAAIGLVGGSAWANPEEVKAAVEGWLGNRFKVDGVIKSPLNGMYEVRMGAELIYVDEKGQFAFVDGNLIDIKNNKNITQGRIDELLKINFSDLPLELAIKQVNGTGKRKVAVFEDPNCPHCRTTRSALMELKDATVYTFPYPVIAADSEIKSKMALCAKDKGKAWNEMVLERKIPDNDGSCVTAMPKLIELGRKLKVTGTPTIFFANGKRIPGGVPAEQLRKLVDANSVG